jgi:hypothetical protein
LSRRQQALEQVLVALEAVEHWVAEHPEAGAAPVVRASPEAARQVRAQDVKRAEDGAVTLRRGVAPERRISIEDAAMRYGRKSRHQRVDGYKRHVLRDLDTGLVRAVGVTPANAPEASITDALVADLQRQGAQWLARHIDRGNLSSRLVHERLPELAVYGKAWPARNGGRFPKTVFALDWEAWPIRCPNEVTILFTVGSMVHFPAAICAACPFQARCTSSAPGQSVSIHPDEPLLQALRARQHSPAGRAQLQEHVAVEHALAHIGRWQGRHARYRGLRKKSV